MYMCMHIRKIIFIIINVKLQNTKCQNENVLVYCIIINITIILISLHHNIEYFVVIFKKLDILIAQSYNNII